MAKECQDCIHYRGYIKALEAKIARLTDEPSVCLKCGGPLQDQLAKDIEICKGCTERGSDG